MTDSMQIRKVKSNEDLDHVFQIRGQVFIAEQNVPEDLEMDSWDRDKRTHYLLAYDDEKPVGCLRLRPYKEQACKVERVAVLQQYRGKQIGKQLMIAAEDMARNLNFDKIFLNAQLQARDFYLKLGYVPVGNVFEEAGIPHVSMEKKL